MKKVLLIVSVLVVLFAFAAPALAQDCAKCRTYPGECSQIDFCVKSCNVAPFQARNCYKAGYITLAACQKIPNSQCVDYCLDNNCNSYPSMCKNAAGCIKNCNIAPFQAQNCFQGGLISQAECKAIYPACVQRDLKCDPCRSYPGECNQIDFCIKSCNVAPFQAQNCYQNKSISLAQCKALYPACK